MKGKYKFLLLALLIAFASCSFTSKKFEDPDKDKLLIQLITYLLDQGHFEPKDINDDFSEEVFEKYLNNIDQFKRFFYASDIEEFEAYKLQIDDQIKAYDVSFFNLTHQRLLQRIAEAKTMYIEILEKPFDFSKKEEYLADYENLTYATNKREMKERWRQQLKFSTIANYDEILSQQEAEMDSADKTIKKKKSIKEIEAEARLATKESIDVLYDYIEDRRRNDWFSVYINAIVEGFDPHTFYFAPEDKERFDRDISGKFEGIGARLQKKIDGIMVNEIISGGPAWRADELEVGDQILKVKQEDEEEAVNVVGMRLDDAIKFIKGPKGTVVTLTLKKWTVQLKIFR